MSTTSLAARVAAPVMEVFASIQGEGLHVGEPQVFLRLRGCPLRCRWCDTPGSWRLGADDLARVASAANGVERAPAWATPFQAACWIAAAEPGAPRTVSLTGGEPLVWPDFVLRLKPLLGERRLHLETAGAHPAALERVLEAVDHVSLDLKLDLDLDPPEELSVPAGIPLPDGAEDSEPTSCRPTAERAPRTADEWALARARCLALVRGRDACGKLVIAGGREAGTFAPLLEEVASHAPELPLILQPATPMNGVPAPAPKLVGAVCEAARELGLAVRVLPQVHRALRVP